MANHKIFIDKINYFPDTNDSDYNGKVLYRQNNRLHHAKIHIDFFWKRIELSKVQNKECKVSATLTKELSLYKDKFFNL